MHDSFINTGRVAKSAVISPKAKIGKNPVIKDWVVIEDDVEIGDNAELHYNAQIENGARLGNNIKVYKSVCISSDPHDLKYGGEETHVYINDNTVIREFSTISRGTKATGKTVIGKNVFLMAYVHIPHDTFIGDHAILSNAVNLGGHVTVEEWAIIGGLSGVHQFTKIGRHSFIGFLSRVNKDVPPYVLAGGSNLSYMGLNIVGLTRRGFTEEQLNPIRQAYRYIYGNKYNTTDALKAIKNEMELTKEVKYIVEFIETSERGIIRGGNQK